MLSDDMTRMAREAGLHLPYWDDDKDPQSGPPSGWAMVSPIGPPLERFARAVERAAYERAAQEREPLSDRQLASACMSYRHDFGLLDDAEQVRLLLEARAWERAFRKEWQR